MKIKSKHNKKKQPNIQIRLVKGLVLILMLSVSISFFYIRDISILNGTINDIVEHPYIVSNSVRDINIYINAIHKSMKDVVLAKNENQLIEAIERVNEYEKLVLEKFDIIWERFLGHPEVVNDAYNLFINWKAIRNKVILLTRNKEFVKAADITKGEGADHVESLLDKTAEMIEFADNKASTYTNESFKILKSVKNKAVSFIVLAFLLGILLFFWIITSINKPLDNIINQIKNVPQNQLINKLPKNEKNKLVLLDFIFRELDEHKKMLEIIVKERTKDLKESQEIINRAINNAPIGIIEVGLNGEFRKANQAFCNIIGYSENELQKLTFYEITLEEDKPASTKILEEVLEGKIPYGKMEKKYIHKSGKIVHVSLTTSLVTDLNKKPLFLFTQIIDITKQKQFENELITHQDILETVVKERTKELDEKAKKLSESQQALTYLVEDVNESRSELEKSNRKLLQVNKELEAFSYSVSHDLKAPLRAIIGFSQIIVEDYHSDIKPEVKRYLGLINDNAENMAKLINELLNLSKMGRAAMRIQQINLNEIAERCKNEILNGIKNRKVTFRIHPMPLVKADKTLMHQVMLNLISNAVKFTAMKSDTIIEVGSTKKNNEVIFYVKDNGIGFDMKYVDKVFSVFQRLHSTEEFQGTGIGLSIVQRVIHKHNGKIWIKSKINKGTTVYFMLKIK